MVTEVSGEADFRQQIGVKGKLVVVSPTCSLVILRVFSRNLDAETSQLLRCFSCRQTGSRELCL